jgi:predicted Holliday junction resolvase-like endonuclease
MKKVIILLIVIFSLSLFLGCQKKAEKVIKEPVEQVEEAVEDTTTKEETKAAEKTEAVEETEVKEEAEENKGDGCIGCIGCGFCC